MCENWNGWKCLLERCALKVGCGVTGWPRKHGGWRGRRAATKSARPSAGRASAREAASARGVMGRRKAGGKGGVAAADLSLLPKQYMIQAH